MSKLIGCLRKDQLHLFNEIDPEAHSILPYLLIGAAPLWLHAGIGATNVQQQAQKIKVGKEKFPKGKLARPIKMEGNE